MLVGERPLAQAVKSFERADPITLPVISPESRFDPGNLIGRLEKRFLEGLLLVKCATILGKPVLQSFPKIAKDNRQTPALISHDSTRNNELAFSSTSNLQFYRFQTQIFFFLSRFRLWYYRKAMLNQEDRISRSDTARQCASNFPLCFFHVQYKRSC